MLVFVLTIKLCLLVMASSTSQKFDKFNIPR